MTHKPNRYGWGKLKEALVSSVPGTVFEATTRKAYCSIHSVAHRHGVVVRVQRTSLMGEARNLIVLHNPHADDKGPESKIARLQQQVDELKRVNQCLMSRVPAGIAFDSYNQKIA